MSALKSDAETYEHNGLIHDGRIVLVPNFEIEPYLCCPRCGGHYLHQTAVNVFEREDDAAIVDTTRVTRSGVEREHIDFSASDIPSARRHGAAIQFWCESCSERDDDIIELTFAQHKGHTLIGWRYAPRRQASETTAD